MGIYLATYPVSDATIERLHADPPLAWRILDPEQPELEAQARADLLPRPGLLARLFRGAKVGPPPPLPPPLELAPGEDDPGLSGDFEKSWHALHYLLTGTADEGEPPLNFLLSGGRELELISGEVPVLTYSSADTRRIAEALLRFTDDEARARANPAVMKRLDIYPGGWDQPENLRFLMEDLVRLKEVVSAVAGRGLGLMVSVS